MDWSISREPDDNLAETRISIGQPKGMNAGYIVFRGDPVKAVVLMMKATEELWASMNGQGSTRIVDKRGRPQG